MRSAVTDYLLNLEEDELINIAADYLGYDYSDVDADVATQWVEGLSDAEVTSIHTEMEGA
jgi:hypothetical protein